MYIKNNNICKINIYGCEILFRTQLQLYILQSHITYHIYILIFKRPFKKITLSTYFNFN